MAFVFLQARLDYFYTYVSDRIMTSADFEYADLSPAEQAVFDANGVYEARFFTNAINTETQGIDLKLDYNYEFANKSKLDLSFWYSLNRNKIQIIP